MMAVNRLISLNKKQPDQISEDCIICCEVVTDKAFVNNCLHYFCFKCIKEWIKVRAVCPLCVQPVNSIINNIRSADDYDLQPVEPPETDVLANYLDGDVDLWAGVEDEDDFNNTVDLSSDESHRIEESTDSDDDSVNDYHCAMDQDYPSDESDASLEEAEDCPTRGLELFSNSEDDEEEEEEVKSYRSSNSEMENDGWQIEDTEYENSDNDDCENDIANDSDENEVELLDSSDCDSDDNSQQNSSPEVFEPLYGEYEYHSDMDDYSYDDTYEDVY